MVEEMDKNIANMHIFWKKEEEDKTKHKIFMFEAHPNPC